MPIIYSLTKYLSIIVTVMAIVSFIAWLYKEEKLAFLIKKWIPLFIFLSLFLYFIFLVLENEARKSLRSQTNLGETNRNLGLLLRTGNELFQTLNLKQIFRAGLAGLSRFISIKRGFALSVDKEGKMRVEATYHISKENAKLIQEKLVRENFFKQFNNLRNNGQVPNVVAKLALPINFPAEQALQLQTVNYFLIPLFSRAIPASAGTATTISKNRELLGALAIEGEFLDAEKNEIFRFFVQGLASAVENGVLHQEVKELSITDALTELYNRRYFFQRFEEELKRAKRFSLPLSFIISDIDNFKDYVDNNGHQMGDFALKTLGRLAKASIRSIDVVGRYGGDEFAYFFPNTDVKEAESVIRRVQERIRKHTFPGKPAFCHLTLSFGASGFPANGQDNEELVRKADEALFLAKRRGKDKICIYGR